MLLNREVLREAIPKKSHKNKWHLQQTRNKSHEDVKNKGEGVIEPMALEFRKPSGKSHTMKTQKSTFTKVTGPDISMLGAHAFKKRSGQRRSEKCREGQRRVEKGREG